MSEDSSNTTSLVRNEQPKYRPGWLIAGIALVATIFFFVAAQTIGVIAVGLYPVLRHWPHDQATVWLNDSVMAQFIFGLIADGLLVIGIALMLRWFHWNWQTIGLKKPAPKHLAYGVLAFGPYFIGYIVLLIVLSLIVPSLKLDQHQEIGFNSVHGTLPLVLTFVSLVVIPPLAEEITMRGFLYSGLRKWLPSVAAAIAVSALFGAAHLAEGGAAGPLWVGAIDTFVLSLFLVGLRELTGNLWAGIVLHAMKNALAFVLLFIIGGR